MYCLGDSLTTIFLVYLGMTGGSLGSPTQSGGAGGGMNQSGLGSASLGSSGMSNPLLGEDARSSSIAQLRMKAKEHSASMATLTTAN